MSKKILITYQDIISTDNLLLAWQEFIIGKKTKTDVQNFGRDLMNNLFQLQSDLHECSYQHGGYKNFYITDPKLRHIHKAAVRDRLVHHAIYRQLYPCFDKTFIADSFSCRNNKGTHAALKRFAVLANKVNCNNTKTCWILKCDVKKFFDSINHEILLNILQQYIVDQKIIWLLENIINSFNQPAGKGLPLGNLTSQLFVNIYMNKFDQFVKHKLRVKYYIRYADDFVLMLNDRNQLISILPKIKDYLAKELNLTLHPNKISISTLVSGIDFLGWVNFPKHKVLRTKTKKRIMTKIENSGQPESLASYLGLLRHGNTYAVQQELLNNYWFWEK